ncbi:MAG: hypothetical protein A3F17_03225 [Gammaproteobacteria bacterium RIFCSPHIGHO2_12_FULL_41_15]|nr:MAG: hypothetical protein A3F17_03225 [Gammaproteobacteria bacterium RIFCSPHIGHO2_12_FULL_41_15]
MQQAPAIHWNWKSFHQLTLDELYDLLHLRMRVFVLEQQCIYLDVDCLDQKSWHLIGYLDDTLVAYLRVLPPGLKQAEVSFGRVALDESVRSKGLGKLMMAKTLAFLQQQYPKAPIKISAQSYLQKFYEAYGFAAQSEPYDDHGVMHIDMQRNFPAEP